VTPVPAGAGQRRRPVQVTPQADQGDRQQYEPAQQTYDAQYAEREDEVVHAGSRLLRRQASGRQEQGDGAEPAKR